MATEETRTPNKRPDASVDQVLLGEFEEHESYAQLVWRRFRRSSAALAGAALVLGLMIMAIAAEFFSP
jgi:ABC-type antimicrobial peptide transport system permease subunit